MVYGESPVTITKANLDPHAYYYRRADPYTGKSINKQIKQNWKPSVPFDLEEWNVNQYKTAGFRGDYFD